MAIIIIKKHRNGSIFGEYRPVVHEFSRPAASAPSTLDPSLPGLEVRRVRVSHFFSSRLISRPTLVKNAREYKELHY